MIRMYVSTFENLSESKVALEISIFKSGRNLATSFTKPKRMSVCRVLSWASSIIKTLHIHIYIHHHQYVAHIYVVHFKSLINKLARFLRGPWAAAQVQTLINLRACAPSERTPIWHAQTACGHSLGMRALAVHAHSASEHLQMLATSRTHCYIGGLSKCMHAGMLNPPHTYTVHGSWEILHNTCPLI